MTSPIVHRDDPQSSFDAASEITASGARLALEVLVTRYLAQYPGQTAAEVADGMFYLRWINRNDRVMVARRLTDAKDDGLLRQGEIRPCRIGYRKCVTWWPVEKRTEPIQERLL